VSESTPGPIAVNMATFIGAGQGGVLGSLLATLGVILPSFIIILIIAALISNLLKYAGVKAFLGGIRPCVVGLILSTAITIGANTLFKFSKIGDVPDIDVGGILIFAVICGMAALFKLVLKKRPSPILMIVISAGLGMLVYSFV
jgi:chromate transporter